MERERDLSVNLDGFAWASLQGMVGPSYCLPSYFYKMFSVNRTMNHNALKWYTMGKRHGLPRKFQRVGVRRTRETL